MSPVEAGSGTGEADPRAPVPHKRRFRCEGCRAVLESLHAWDSVTCSCGSLTVSGPPNNPRISWAGIPGSGWSDVTDLDDAGDHPARDPAAFGYGRPGEVSTAPRM